VQRGVQEGQEEELEPDREVPKWVAIRLH
jgi:hypothetical protein